MPSDRQILRELIKPYLEIAHLPVQRQRARQYRDLNSLRSTRPVVLLDELPWHELNGDGFLTLCCQDAFCRDIEQFLRRALYKWRLPSDMLVLPEIPYPRAIRIGDIGVAVRETTLSVDPGNNIVSHAYQDCLSTMDQLEALHVPTVEIDEEADRRNLERAAELFGDLVPLRLTGYMNHFAPWDNIAMWRGVGPLLTDLVERPDFMHQTMERLVTIQLALLEKLEALNALEAHAELVHCTPAYADELPGPGFNPDHVTRADQWGRGTAQIFASVSPAMHEEFEIAYMRRFFRGSGLVYYGCCEPLHRKMDIVKTLPNLRKVSVTPWADVRMCAEAMGPGYVLSRKPKPAAVAVPSLDRTALARDIEETLAICRETGTPCEFILKDISTCAGNPQNLYDWGRTVMDVVGG